MQTQKKGPISDINVTPLVDVMLVLLVIFMITAPMLFSGINLELPKTKKVNTLNLNSKQIVLSLTRAGDIYLGQQKILSTEVLKVIRSKFQEYKTDTVFIRADYNLNYGKVARLMAELKREGVTKISLVTEPIKE